MLNRQKVVLRMLQEAGRPVGRVELMKWCFLLRHETPSGGGSSFYDFVPYRYGPFSFSLYQELGKLESLGQVACDGDPNAWCWIGSHAEAITGIPVGVAADLEQIVSKYRRFATTELLDLVYSRYPDFTVNSERQRLAARPKTGVGIYTAGYETLSVDRFLNLLVQSGMERLIDVRNNPVSRRYGFHKSTLARLSERLGIDYVHFPELGIRSETRHKFLESDGRSLMFDHYEESTLQSEGPSLSAVLRLLTEKPGVLVCMEAELQQCHRSRLANHLSERTNLTVTHLRAEP